MVQRTGNFVRDKVPEEGAYPSQPLSVAGVEKQPGDAVVGGRGLLRRERADVPSRSRREFKQRAREDAVDLLGRAGVDPNSSEKFYRIDEEEHYFLTFAESVTVPEGSVGVVRPRDALQRTGAMLGDSFVGAGEDPVQAQIFVDDEFLLIAEEATVAELVVVEALG